MNVTINGQMLFGWSIEQENMVEHMLRRILILPDSAQLIKKVRQHVSDPKAYSSWIITCGNIFSLEIYKTLLHTLEESKENSEIQKRFNVWIFELYSKQSISIVDVFKIAEKIEKYCKTYIYDNMTYDEKALNIFHFNPDNVMNQLIWDKNCWSIQLMERRLFELIFKKIIDKRILRDALKYVQSNLKRFDIDTTGYETLKEIAEEILFVIEDAGIEANPKLVMSK